MGKVFDAIPEFGIEWIANQKFFIVATAPSIGGHVNASPKGLGTFRILSPTRVAYLDVTGTGNETAAHIVDNGRLTFMFMSFDKAALIVRLYGQGRVVLPCDEEWTELAPHFEILPGTRQIIVADLDRVATSCGYGVPRYELVEERTALLKWAELQGEPGLEKMWRGLNMSSIDGLPTGIERRFALGGSGVSDAA